MQRSLLLADDHQLFLDGLRLLIDRIEGWTVVGEAHSGTDVLNFVKTRTVDCILMDLEMPILGGIEATRLIKAKYPGIHIIAVSMMSDYVSIKKMLQAGANGYLVKNTGIAELKLALEEVTNGQFYLSPQLGSVLLDGVAGRKSVTKSNEALSKREKEIATLIVDGLTNDQIAEKLFLSPQTINTHRKNILGKLGCKNTASMVRYLLENRVLVS